MNENYLETLIKENEGEDVCICGHFKIDHEHEDIKSCYGCNLSMWIPVNNVCRQFKLNNLKYLEAKAKTKLI